MKIITIKQPWATLIAEGYKKYEFRSWKTSYRGEMLIHAGAGVDKEAMEKFSSLNLTYPKFKVLAKVQLVDCIKIDDDNYQKINLENELVYGNKKRDGYAWKLTIVEKIDSNKEIKGKLGLWNIEDI